MLAVDASRVGEVAAGRRPFLQRGAEANLPTVLAHGRLCVTTAHGVIAESAVMIVTIETPVDEFMDPSVGLFPPALVDKPEAVGFHFLLPTVAGLGWRSAA